MWKKMTTLWAALLALGMLLSGAAMAEQEEIWVQDGRLMTREDGVVLLHLMIGKTGPALQLDNVSVVFLDASGATAPMAQVGLHSAAVMTLPEGEVYFPVTLAALPEAGAEEIVGFRVTGLYTSEPAPGSIAQIRQAGGVFLMKGPAQDELTAFAQAWAGEDPSVYGGYAFIFDREGAYLGNVCLPQGGGAVVAGGEMLSALARAVRWEESALLEAGFPRNAPDCVLFGAIPMSDLPRDVAPGGAAAYVCAIPPAQTQTLAIVDFTLEAAQGRFVIHAVACNQSSGTVRLTGVPYVALHDEQGRVVICTDLTLSAAQTRYAPGETQSFILEGALEEGFVPVACAFVTECAPESTK